MHEKKIYHDNTLYLTLNATFSVLVLLSNLLTVKFVKAPFLTFGFPAGLLTYPFTFLICDVVTEVWGKDKAKKMVYVGLFTTLFAQLLISICLCLPSSTPENEKLFSEAFGLNSLVTCGSLIAYLTSQITDIAIFTKIKAWTKGSHLWLRNNVSTLISQLLDTFIVNFFVFYFGLQYEVKDTLNLIAVSYSCKVIFTLLHTPICYLAVKYAHKMRGDKGGHLELQQA
jgi:queuosine precursor transporter